MARSKKLNRRTVLKGLGGAVVGLPVLEAMLDDHGTAFAQASGGGALPPRYAIVFAGMPLGGDDHDKETSRINGTLMSTPGHHIVPLQSGADYELTTPLRPLAGLQQDFSLVSNMRIPYDVNSAEPDAVPPGGAFRDFHGGGCSPLLSGTRSESASFTCNGPTSDQVIAAMHAGQTPVPSLVLRAQPSFYLSGYSFAGRHRMSYRGAGDPVEAQDSPQTAFQSLFGNFVPVDTGAQAEHDFRQRMRRSVLDLVLGKRDALLSRVGNADRIRLERHFDEIRALEERVASLPIDAAGQCQKLADPGSDAPVGGDNAGAGSDAIGTNTGYSDEAGRTRVMADLIHMAFVCDLTRAATLQITAFQSHMNVYPISGNFDSPIPFDRALLADLHEVGHNGDAEFRGQLPVSLCLQWHIEHYAYLLQKMKDTPEGAGSLLDNSVLIFANEAGHGRHLNTPSDTAPKTHSVEEMVMLIGGRAGGLSPGRHIATDGAHPGQALISAMQAAGYSGDSLGEVSGNIPELFA
ncbi:MAG: DUF1552 domain-containing protein [Myxococcales bacterium]|nr:DUF1552 domain-containing protein [Myxococcales bacterium]